MGTERRKTILRMVQGIGSASVAQLCAALGAFAATIHRDLVALAKEGAVERVHGGIFAPAGGADGPHVLGEKAHRRGEKAETARTALSFASPEVHSVFLEASTTVAQFGLLLRECRGLVFLTNSLEITLEFVAEGLEVTLVEGQLRACTLATVGSNANRQISLSRIDVAFIGVSAIDVDGLSSMNAIEAETKTTIIAASRAVIAPGDHPKLGKRGLAHVARADVISALMTDACADDAVVEALKSCGLEVIIAEGRYSTPLLPFGTDAFAPYAGFRSEPCGCGVAVRHDLL